ncbi:T9SS C-terminal target domain-containing protein [candidate division KSB1 bacterium]|nr:MAG: T9SS C-terminal target domain-containing protein [candidate division KSB1 bacterium]
MRALKYRLCFSLLLCTPLILLAQPDTVWTRTFGGTQGDICYSVQRTQDGGYIMAGETRSSGAGGRDFWLVKTTSVGSMQWNRTYGGAQDETCYAVHQASDGGYVLVGRTNSFRPGSWNGWVVRTNASGDTMWTRVFGGSQPDAFYSVAQGPGGFFWAAGYTYSYGLAGDYWLVQLSTFGDSITTHTYGGNRSEVCNKILIENDYMYLVGSTESYGQGQTGLPDYWLLKVSWLGDSVWSRPYGEDRSDVCTSIAAGDSGSLILGGYTESSGAGRADFWVIRTDSMGYLWNERTFGRTGQDYCQAVMQVAPNRIQVAGTTEYTAAGGNNGWLLEMDNNLDTLWNRQVGGASVDEIYAMVSSMDGTILTGGTWSFGSGQQDFWLVKIAAPVTLFEVTPIFLNFGEVPVGYSATRSLTLRNAGNMPVTVLNLVTVPPFSSEFSSGFVLNGNEQTSFTVFFQPAQAGEYIDTLWVEHSTATSPTAVYVSGTGIMSDADEPDQNLPQRFALSAAYPNPFNAETVLTFDVPHAAPVRVAIYDVQGQLTKTIADGMLPAGSHRLHWNGSAFASGIYFVRAQSDGFSAARKIVLLK